MDDRDKHMLEGLLKARSANIGRRRGRPSRTESSPTAPVWDEAAAPVAAALRRCRECSIEIGPARLGAVPSATRCLSCQRTVEAASSGHG